VLTRRPNCRRSGLFASIHLLFVYFPRLWAAAVLPGRVAKVGLGPVAQSPLCHSAPPCRTAVLITVAAGWRSATSA
jgi:hypothetical protein